MRVKLSTRLFTGNKTDCTDGELQQQHLEHRLNTRARLRVSTEDVARMVSEFAVSRGGITKCPPAYAALSPQYKL
jgi:hypothetical protein